MEPMTVDQQIEQVELSIENAKDAVSSAKAFDELSRDRNFKKIIEEGYFKEEAQRLVMLKSDPNMQDDASQKAIDYSIRAIGELRQYFASLLHFGRMAENAIAEDEDTLDELRAEAA